MEAWLREIDFFVFRHALSRGQAQPQAYWMFGDTNNPLAQHGIVQTLELGDFFDDYFRINPPKGKILMLSSEHARCVQTGSAALSCIEYPVEVLRRSYIGEHRFGELNGPFNSDAHNTHADFFVAQAVAEERGARCFLRYPGVDADGIAGESQQDVYSRVQGIFADARAAYDRGVRTIMVSTHGSSGRAIQMNLMGVACSDANWKSWRRPRNCQVDLISGGERHIALFPGFEDPTALPVRSNPTLSTLNDMSLA